MRFKATVATKLFRFASLDAHIIQQLCPVGSGQMDMVECYDPSESDWDRSWQIRLLDDPRNREDSVQGNRPRKRS